MPAAFGWLTDLTKILNENHQGQWAYTGSFAIYVHAHVLLQQEARQPNDIDILCYEPQDVLATIKANLYVESVLKKTKFIELKNVKITRQASNVPTPANIDILQHGTYGSLRQVIVYRQGAQQYPVEAIQSLLMTKLDLEDLDKKSNFEVDVAMLQKMASLDVHTTSLSPNKPRTKGKVIDRNGLKPLKLNF